MNKAQAACSYYRVCPLGTVTVATRKDQADHALTVDFSGCYEQPICSRPGVFNLRAITEEYDPWLNDLQVLVRRRQIDPPRHDIFTVLSVSNGE